MPRPSRAAEWPVNIWRDRQRPARRHRRLSAACLGSVRLHKTLRTRLHPNDSLPAAADARPVYLGTARRRGVGQPFWCGPAAVRRGVRVGLDAVSSSAGGDRHGSQRCHSELSAARLPTRAAPAGHRQPSPADEPSRTEAPGVETVSETPNLLLKVKVPVIEPCLMAGKTPLYIESSISPAGLDVALSGTQPCWL